MTHTIDFFFVSYLNVLISILNLIEQTLAGNLKYSYFHVHGISIRYKIKTITYSIAADRSRYLIFSLYFILICLVEFG